MKKITLSVQEFSQPSPRRGSIEPSSTVATSLRQGIELHQKIQSLRLQENIEYFCEESVNAVFETSLYEFVVSGRMDGFIPGPVPVIEEIKSSFNIYDLAKTIKDKRFDHPYFIQLISYGYFYWKEHGVKPRLNFVLVSSRRDETYSFEAYWDIKEYEAWLKRRLKELEEQAIASEKRTSRRELLSQTIPFPFQKLRRGQGELIDFISAGMRQGKKLLLQAPTGLGKTIGVLYPALKESLARGQRVIYLTPKNSQQAIAEEAIEKIQASGCQTRSLTITAKSKICMKAEPLCNPEYCEFARDYYDKLEKHKIKAELSRKKKLTARVMKNLATKYEVCPFELQLEAVEDADVVICDYNYVFAHQSALGKLSACGHSQTGKPNLVIDEAHNLPARTMGNFSPALSTYFLESLRSGIDQLPKKFRREYESLLNSAVETIKNLCPEKIETKPIVPDLDDFILMNEELKSFLSGYLDSDVEIKSKDVVLKLVFYWGEFTDILSVLKPDQTQFFMTAQNDGKNQSIKIVCCDASLLIKERYSFFENLVLFSATLKPFDYYIRLAGLSDLDLMTAEFLSPFNKENRKVLIIPQISTKYSVRQQNYPRIAETITRISGVQKGNYLAFFPSFDFLENVLKLVKVPEGFRVLKQSRYMRNEDVEETLEFLRSNAESTILFAVQGGVFSEGIDYAGDMVIGAFVIGPPLPSFDFEREKMREYYQNSYQSGFEYAYTYPAMAKAVQAAGRVIRTESDKGIIVLMDDRFLDKSYSQSLPRDWFQESPLELVSRTILSDVSDFWNQPSMMGELTPTGNRPVDDQQDNCPKN